MDEYPVPDEEYEVMHADELELMREMHGFDEEESAIQAANISPRVKCCLKFTSPPADRTTPKDNESSNDSAPGMTQLDENCSGSHNVQKRPADDVFEDDVEQFLIEDSLGNRKKRHKPLVPEVCIGFKDPTLDLAAHEADLSLIERINDIRKSLHTNEFLKSAPSTGDIRTEHMARIYPHLPDGAFQSITTETGERFYLTKIEEEEWDNQISSVAIAQKTTCFLNTPYTVLKAKAENEQIRQDAKRAACLKEAEDSGMESGMEEEDESNKEALWVEKFKPKHYVHLLSDESTNRTVLHWVKLWDKLVFGVDKRPRQKEEKKKDLSKDKAFKKFPRKNKPEVVDELDDQNRPIQKAILLCGPPGLGKTTLAHIIAHHAGYNVVEMNASDDRSVDTFQTNLENATSMKSVLGPNPRPNCLVIDEIDGAPAPSINLLVNMLNGKDTGGKGKKGKKKDGPVILRRPVICICNELYTPALRPLRQIALVIQFPPTQTTRLAHRLQEISKKRHLKANMTVLMALCDKTENDIRSCLSVLQFVRSTKKDISLNDVDSAAVGQKDYQRSLFNVWHDIFSIPRLKKRRCANPHELQHSNGVLIPMPDLEGDLDNFGDEVSLASRFQRMLRTTQSCGEHDRLTQGWFENYLNIEFKLTNMELVSNGLAWATFTDVVRKEIMHSQSWNMMAFLPYSCVAYHLLFATHRWPKIHYPNQMHEMNQKLIKNQNLQASMINEMIPMTRVFVGKSLLVQDVLPYLLHIIKPNLRPVNTQLYSKQEKEELAGLMNTMIAYNLRYSQERNLDGQYSFILDPNMEEVVHFPDIKPCKQLSYATRQLISREISMEKVRRAESYFVNQNVNEEAKANIEVPTSKVQTVSKTAAPGTPLANIASKKSLANHLQKLDAKPIAEINTFQGSSKAISGEVTQVARDFFGRIISQTDDNHKKSTTNEIVKSDIWCRFKEGYSNAVRRPIKMKDLA